MVQAERDLLSLYLKNFVDTNEVKNLGNDWFEHLAGFKVFVHTLDDAWGFAEVHGLTLTEDAFTKATDAIVAFELLLAKHKAKAKKN